MASALFTRWFQANVFTPGNLLSPAAPVPPATQPVLVDFFRLGRRFAPYVESFGGTASSGRTAAGSPPPASLKAYAAAGGSLTRFAFGPSVLAQPVPVAETGGGPERGDLPVYLPAESAWFDFWTGAAYAGGETIHTPAPIEILPLFVRAGSILPLAPAAPGPVDASEADVLEIRIYPGADARLVLPDSNKVPGASTAASATGTGAVSAEPASILFEWDDRARLLRIGARSGGGAWSLKRRFAIVLVRPAHGVGHFPPPRPDREIVYDGSELSFTFPAFPPPPRPPVGLAAKVLGERVRFTWQQSYQGVVYRLKRVAGSGGPCEDVASGLQTPGCTIPLSECGPGFRYIVTAMNAGGESQPSAPAEVILDPQPSPNARPERLPFNAAGLSARTKLDSHRLVDARPSLVAMDSMRTFHAGAGSGALVRLRPCARAAAPGRARSTGDATQKTRALAESQRPRPGP